MVIDGDVQYSVDLLKLQLEKLLKTALKFAGDAFTPEPLRYRIDYLSRISWQQEPE